MMSFFCQMEVCNPLPSIIICCITRLGYPLQIP